MDPRTGLYSKAAKIIRSLPQERGTVDQMIGAARKLGLRDAELQNAGEMPTGKIDREELAKLFEARLPTLRIDQLGENPSYLQPHERQRYRELGNRLGRQEQVSPEEEQEYRMLQQRTSAGPNVMMRDVGLDEDDKDEPVDTEYSGYASDGTKNYRERLLKLDQKAHPAVRAEKIMDSLWGRIAYETPIYGADHPIIQGYQRRIGELQQERDSAVRQLGAPMAAGQRYQSAHWTGHPDVVAHIRMSDRMVGEDSESVWPIAERVANHFKAGVRELGSYAAEQAVKDGVISPEEAASLSRLMGFRLSKHFSLPGIGKRLLHVEELQSDWAQEGRDKGFKDKPYRVWDKRTGKTVSEHDTHDEAWDTYRTHPDSERLDYGHNNAPPPGPYVQNTQHWTDLALKNVLREAALGNYDGIVFPAGQNQADRYGLEKHLDTLTYHPKSQRLTGYRGEDDVFQKDAVEPKDLAAHVGKEVADRLLDPQNARNAGTDDQIHVLQGDGLKAGGQGMRGYYDGIVPKSAMNLARQHDPEIRPAEPVSYSEGRNEYSGFHLPMTDKLRQGILNEGFSAMRRGGRVDAAINLTRRFTKDGKGATMGLGVKE